MKNNSKIILLVILLTLSLSCSLFASNTTSTPTAPIVRATDTPISSAPTTAPASLNASGPYVLFAGPGGLSISNPDGSFLTQVSNLDFSESDLRQTVSPKGDRAALVVRTDQGLDLVLISIPSGETKTIAHLLDVTQNELTTKPTSGLSFAYYAIAQYNSVAWSPDGSQLAFMGAIKGPTSDLYLYNISSGQITQLTDGPSQAILPSWSPDGQYILHYGVSWVPPFGGAIIGYTQMDGVWAVRMSDEKVLTEPKPKGLHDNFVGWQDDTHYMTYDSDDQCFSQNLRIVDVTSGKTTPVMNLSFYYGIAQSPENHALLFAGAAGCSNSPGDGTFLLLPGQTEPAKLTDKKSYEVYWLPESGVFQAYPEALFSSDGRTRYDPPVYDASYHPAISKQGYQAWEVIQNQQGRIVVKTSTEDLKTILNVSANQLIWDPVNGDTLFIASRNGSLYSASHPDFTPRLMGKTGSVNQAIWLP